MDRSGQGVQAPGMGNPILGHDNSAGPSGLVFSVLPKECGNKKVIREGPGAQTQNR